MMSQTAFDWTEPDRYADLWNFEMEVVHILQMKMYHLNDAEKVPIIKNWIGREGLQSIQTPTNTEKDTCKMQHDCSMC